MIQLNLLPDVKTQYITTRRTKRMVLLIDMIVAGVALGSVALLALIVFGTQPFNLNQLDEDISQANKSLQQIAGLEEILTVQNQLSKVNDLHTQKPVMTRLLPIVTQVTPSDVQIATLNVDTANQTISITGDSQSVAAVNKFADSLKYSNYYTDPSEGSAEARLAFKNVVLSTIGPSEEAIAYTITLQYEPDIFDSKYPKLKLVVPNIQSTRSVELFTKPKVDIKNTDEVQP